MNACYITGTIAEHTAKTNFNLLIGWLAGGKYAERKYLTLNKSVKQIISMIFCYSKYRIITEIVL